MQRFLISILLLAGLSFAIRGNEKDKEVLSLQADAVEGLTGESVRTAAGRISDALTGDSISGASRQFSMVGRGNDMDFVTTLSFDIPRAPGQYLIEAYAEGYDTIRRTITIKHIGSREFVRKMPNLVFNRSPRTLKEVTVTASKVKFYLNGDTLVYNADAFQVAAGSMLDVLIKQLPGVELREGGEIYVNGRFVESLLLNGKDFFKGDNNIMLNNLGAYTVKNVAVYEQWSRRSMLAGQDLGDSEYVMDVRLKKEYLSGYVGNFEGGAGSSSRYLARLFGMWFTTRSRVTLVGALNNLNDSRTPGQNDSWKASVVPGDMRTKTGGIDYNLTSEDGERWELRGSTSVTHTRNNDISTVNQTNFLPGNDTYDYRFSQSLNRNLKVNTNNSAQWNPDNKFIYVNHYLDYEKQDFHSSMLSGAFRSEVASISRELLEQVFGGTPTSLSSLAINNVLYQSLGSGKLLSTGGSFQSSFNLPYSPDIFSLVAGGKYSSHTNDMFNMYDIRYQASDSRRFDNQYINNSPDRAWNVYLAPSYTFIPTSDCSIDFSMRLNHEANHKNSYLYQLDRMADTGKFGVLPAGFQSSLDNDQTYFSREKTDDALLQINAIRRVTLSNNATLSFQILPSATMRWRTLDYAQGEYSTHLSKRSFDISFHNTYISYRKEPDTFKFLFNRSIQTAPLNRMVTIPDARDPMNIFLGATALKNAADNQLSVQWVRMTRSRHRWSNNLDLRYIFITNALSNGYWYDETTGVRTYRMFNTNGNFNLRLGDSFSKAFGSKDQFDIATYSSIDYGEAGDMVGTSASEMLRTKVSNLILLQQMTANWSLGRHKFSINGSVNWRHTRGSDVGFSNFSATTAKYGASAQIGLPLGFSLSTDITLYTRRGFASPELNTTDVVWNARLSCQLKGGRWLFMLDGFDILHQLSNVTYNVNPQARVETFTNVLPSYALCHVQYRFMVQPRNKR